MKNNHLAKSIGIGLAVGGASAVIGSAVMKRGRHHGRAHAKRSVHQVMKTVGNVVDNVQSMLK